MPLLDSATETYLSTSQHGRPTITLVAAAICLIWYIVVAFVCLLGYFQLLRYYSSPPEYISPTDVDAGPEVTIIRPVKGLEPSLYDCLASTFYQSYPKQKLHIRYCVSSRTDPAFPVLERLIRDFPDHDVRILVEDEDELLQNGTLVLGPNPKIRNMSRAYREAFKGEGDVAWIVDCNVWVGKYALGRMLTKLSGNKYVHQLPLVFDTVGTSPSEEIHGLLHGDANIQTSSTSMHLHSRDRTWWNIGGGRLEEIFMSSAHAKFYTAINTVLIAPCTLGKSTMFRTSHLDSLTNNQGIDYFSENICEDQLIGDILWKHKVPEELRGVKLGTHALCFGDLALQPMSNMSVGEYWSRRVRWLRVRKFTVTLATFVEPGTECFLCSLYGAFAITTLPIFERTFGLPPTWPTFFLFLCVSISLWCATDWTLYKLLHSASSIHVDEHTPAFARPPRDGRRRPFYEWLPAWLGRETLALPIWLWAFYGGTKVEWKGKRFWVGMDMRVHEILEGEGEGMTNGHINGKARRD